MRDTVEELEQDLLDEEQCWQAVLTRNAQADGTFVVAVRTTGIYCRPSCPARNPYREHVTFFRLPEEASVAGFRPCRRCHPDQVHQPDSQTELIERVCHYIQTHLRSSIAFS